MTFYSLLSHYYEEIFPCDPDLVEFILSRTEKGDAILDAGCGTGELVRKLNEKGVDARGFDLDPGMVALAEEKSGGKGLFKEEDLLTFSKAYGPSSFSILNCVGNTVAHIDREEVTRFLEQAGTVLRPRGILILQTLNYERLTSDGIDFPDRKTEHCLFQRSYRKGEESGLYYFETRLTDLDSGEHFPSRVSHYPLKPDELGELIEQSGYRNIRFMGDWKGELPSPGKLPLMVMAESL